MITKYTPTHPCNSSDAECDFERMYTNVARERKELRTERHALVAALIAIVAATDYGRDAASMGEARAHELARAALAKVQS